MTMIRTKKTEPLFYIKLLLISWENTALDFVEMLNPNPFGLAIKNNGKAMKLKIANIVERKAYLNFKLIVAY